MAARYRHSISYGGGSRRISAYSLSKPTTLGGLTRTQKTVIALGATSQALQFFAESMVPLLFPPQSIAKNLTHIQYGLTMAVFSLLLGLFDPFQCIVVPYVGVKYGFIGTTMIAGVGYVAFGLLHYVANSAAFFGAALVIRALQGANFAVLMALETTMMCLVLGDAAGVGFAIGTFTEGIGYAVGPTIAGPLAQVTSFAVPFVIAGGLGIVTSFSGWCLLQNPRISAEAARFKLADVRLLLWDRLILASLWLLILFAFTWTMVHVTLEQHFARYNFGIGAEGLMFGLGDAAYGLSAPLWSWLGSRNSDNFSLYSMLLSPFLSAAANVFLGPIPGLEAIHGHVGVDLVCLVVVRVSMSMLSVGASMVILKQCEVKGLGSNIATYALVASLWYTPYCLGDVTGTIAGVHIFSTAGFPTLTLLNVILLTFAGAVSLCLVFCKRCGATDLHRMPGSTSYDPAAHKPLLDRNPSTITEGQPAPPALSYGAI